MPTGRATTFAVENHEGLLYNVSSTDTKFLSMLGGLFGGEPITGAIIIPWQEHELRDAAVRARTEGADAQTATHVVRTPVHNVLQITQETIDTSYTKRATSKQLADVGSAHPAIVTAGMENPVGDEHDWQIAQAFKEYGRDVEFAIIQGGFVEPASIGTARETRGIIAATVSNHTDKGANATNVTGEDSDDLIDATAHPFSDNDKVQFTALVGGSNLELNRTYYVVTEQANTFQLADSLGGAPLSFGSDITATSTIETVADVSEDDVLQILQDAYDNNGLQEEEMAVVMVNSWNKRQLTDIFITQKNYREMSRKIAGVSVTTIITDFGELNVVMNRFMVKNTLQVISMEQCKICFLVLDTGEKIRVEELGRDGARDRTQVYWEFGLRYGNELTHAKLTGLSTR